MNQLERIGTTEIRELTEKAKALASELGGLLPEAKRLADASVVLAWKLGDVCIEAKEKVGHGHFLFWLECAGISQPSASRYVALRAKYSTLNDLNEANAMRQGYLKLLVPGKEKKELIGDANIGAPPINCYKVVNTFCKWRTEYGEKVDAATVRKDFREIFEWLMPFFTETEAA